jgi:hypothetical protein
LLNCIPILESCLSQSYDMLLTSRQDLLYCWGVPYSPWNRFLSKYSVRSCDRPLNWEDCNSPERRLPDRIKVSKFVSLDVEDGIAPSNMTTGIKIWCMLMMIMIRYRWWWCMRLTNSTLTHLSVDYSRGSVLSVRPNLQSWQGSPPSAYYSTDRALPNGIDCIWRAVYPLNTGHKHYREMIKFSC